MLFSVVLIARNEIRTLPRMLTSLQEFQSRGGEVIIVDTGSSDGTRELARAAGCKVYEAGERFRLTVDADEANAVNATFVVDGEEPIIRAGDRVFDYSAARNYAATLPQHDMIVMPDCDEVFTRFDLDALNAAIAAGVERIDCNYVYSHDEWGNEAIKFARTRIYDRRKMTWRGIIHEYLDGDAKSELLGEDVLKLDHWQNPQKNRGQDLIGLGIDCLHHPDSDRNSHYLGRELLWAGRPRSAIRELERHIAMNRWAAERAQSMIYIGDCHGALGQHQQQTDAYWHAFGIDATRREALIRLARLYFQRGDALRTACLTAAAMEIPWHPFYANLRTDYTSYPRELMYWAKWRLGEMDAARFHWREALRYSPQNARCLSDARYFLTLPPVSIVVIANEQQGTPEALLNLIDTRALYPDYETIVHLEDSSGANGLPAILRDVLSLVTGQYVLFLEQGLSPEPQFLIQAMLRMLDSPAPQETVVQLLAPRACWLASKELLAQIATEQSAHRDIGSYAGGGMLLRDAPLARASLWPAAI